MHVAICVITFRLFGIDSLKSKRSQIKPLLKRLPTQFNVAVAEIDGHDSYQTAVICLVNVGVDSGRLHSQHEKAVAWIEKARPDLRIENYSIEFL